MPDPITREDLENAKIDVGLLAEAANENKMVQPRYGDSYRSVPKLIEDFESGLFQGAKGDPGGNVMSIGLFTDAFGLTIPVGTDLIQTSGFASVGKGQARYHRWAAPMAALAAWGEDIWWFEDLSGAKFELAEPVPNVQQFGAIGDAVHAYLGTTIAGTDDTVAIQRALDYCIRVKRLPALFLPQGLYKTTDTIHVNYGDSFRNLKLFGSTPIYAPWDSSLGGCGIMSTRSDRPVISIQGGRQMQIEGVGVFGLLYKHIIEQGLGNAPSPDPLLDDTLPASWDDPALAATQDSRYAPFCGISIDAYSGVRPGTSYPDVTYPAWTGIVTQYGKNFTSEVTIRHCNIIGVTAAVCVQPSDADGNGDFLKLDRVFASYCKYRISVGNTQSRNIEDLDGLGQSIFCQYESLKHGRQTGRFHGVVKNYSGGKTINLFNAHSTHGPPWSFENCYIEGLWRIGSIVGGTSAPTIFSSCDFYFLTATARGRPATHFDGSSNYGLTPVTTNKPLRFIGCQIYTQSVLVLYSSNVSYDAYTYNQEYVDVGGNIPLYAAYAINGLAGGLVLQNFGLSQEALSRVSSTWKGRNGLTGAPASDMAMLGGLFKYATRAFGSPIYAERLFGLNSGDYVDAPRRVNTFGLAGLSGQTLVGRKLTLTMTGYGAASDRRALMPGDIMLHLETASVFFISSFDAATQVLIAKLQNNFKGAPGSETPVVPFNPAVGTILTISSRAYTPNYPLFVDSSATFTAVGDTNTSVVLTNVVVASRVQPGMKVTGTGIPADTFVIGVVGSSVYISAAATATAAGITFTFGTASAVLTNVGDFFGDQGDYSTAIAVGDYMARELFTDDFVSTDNVTVSSMAASATPFASTITMSANAKLTARRQRIKILRVAAPPNVTNP